MYNINIKQVKNGFFVVVSKSSNNSSPATSLEGMIGNMMGMASQMENQDSKLHSIQNDSPYIGEHIFKNYSECVAFLQMLEDEIK